MLENATQDTRQISVSTVLPKDKLLLKRISGIQRFSQPFEFELEMLSHDDNVTPTPLIGSGVTMVVDQLDEPTFFHGMVSRFRYAGQNDLGASYLATVNPWFWFLKHTTDCRIFQEKTVPEILQEVLSEAPGSDFDVSKLTENYPTLEYCVQYRESDFQFCSRLMEEYGITYFFEHRNGGHRMVLADSISAFTPIAESKVVVSGTEKPDDLEFQITSWQHSYAFKSGAWEQRDFNFKSPTAKMKTDEQTMMEIETAKSFEVYDYPGRYVDKAKGKQLTRIRMEELEAQHDTVKGTGSYRSFFPGKTFEVAKHLSKAEKGKKYLVTEVSFAADVGDSYKTGDHDGYVYQNRFEGIPDQTPYRPPRMTPRPVVEGPQTAVVSGKKGEEIHPDEFGRVKVQFHWDRYGNSDENSSCWIRVSQAHAGKKWGGIDLPRIGEEVIVDFLEGDPDFPIITGRVYNGEAMPPFALPGEMTRSGMKSNTHKGSGYNEMSMDDTAGKEQIRTNAQYNMDTTVGNNQTLIVNNDRTGDIGNNDTLTVGNDSTESVGNNKDVTIGNNLNINVGNKMVLNAGSSITLKCGASKIYMNSGGVITISGTIITTAAAANAAVAAPFTQVIGGVMLTTVGGVNSMNGGVTKVAAAGLCSVSGGKVDVVSPGVTSIKGGTITLN